jgi:hypothetical protein
MSDLKDLCDRMVADAPPMPAGAAVLAAARRSAARHRRVRLATAGAVAAVVVAVVALGAQGGFLTGRTQPATNASPSPTDRVDRHQRKMFELLKAALPADYTISWWDPPRVQRSGSSPPDVPPEVRASLSAALESARNNPQPQRRVSTFVTQTVVSNGRGEGTVSAILMLGHKAATSDCWTNESITCEKVTVNGVTLDVKTDRDNRGVQIWTVRDLPDGQLQISADQSYPTFADPDVHTPKLEPFPFTPRWMAERATDPRFVEVG